MRNRLTTVIVAVAALAGIAIAQPTAQSQGQARDEDLRWRMPLAEKADVIQRAIYDRHWILGTYPSQVRVYADGRSVTHTTEGESNIAHTSSWTGSYIMGAAFRYGWAKEHGTPADVEAALNLGGQMVNGLYLLSHVSGKPGFLSRGVAPGYGPTYEERYGTDKRDEWYQGAPPYQHLRFRTDPSHHNYDQVTRGLSFWYYFLHKYNPNPTGRVKAQMDSVKTALTDILNYAYKAENLTVRNLDGNANTTLLGFNEGQGQPSTRVLMVTNALTYVGWITGDPWARTKKQEIVRDYHYLDAGAARNVRSGADDMEHTIGGLWLAYQVETDAALKQFYKEAATNLFERFRQARRPLFNYLYADMTGDRAGADLPGALATLQLYPTNTLMYPVMNSIRTDVEFVENQGRRYTKDVLPFNEIPMDNEYDWKGEPQNVDGWLSRPITALAVSPETPMVWLLADGTDMLYYTLDGGKTFKVNDYRKGDAIRDIVFAGGKTRIAILATDRGIYRTARLGHQNTWDLVAVGTEGNPVTDLQVDTANPNVLWAVTRDGVWRSVDYGRDEIGTMWEKVSSAFPPDWTVSYYLASTAPPVVYATRAGRIYRAGADGKWAESPMGGFLRYGELRQIVATPGKPDAILALVNVRLRGNFSLILRSEDGGRTVAGTARGTRALLASIESSGLGQTELMSIAIDPTDVRVVYASSQKGMFRSADGGTTWTLANSGLRIPFAYAMHAPANAGGKIFASTPAGLHVSADRGATWSQPIVVLNGPGVDRLDRGGMGYLVGYWPGRYFGYVTEEQITARP